MRAALVATTFLLLLSGCDSGPPQQPIVVYAIGEDESVLATELTGFTDDTGIPVTLMFSKSSKHADLVIDNSGSPPADVLVTNNVADIWRAADEGALRMIRSEKLATVPEILKDPDGLWVASKQRLTVVVVNRETGNTDFDSFNYLASAELLGQLCVLRSASSLSRSLIAMLITELGEKPAERLVRGWMRNLAKVPFNSEQALLEAVRSGVCVYGIVSDATVDGSTHVVVPEPVYFDIDGVGIARHARNPESAGTLVDWMITRRQSSPEIVSDHNIGIAGWRDEDAGLLAERAGYH